MQKNKGIFLFFLLMLFFTAGCTSVPAVQKSDDGTLVIGEVYTLSSGKTLQGDVAVVGSSFTIEEGAFVNGDISLIGSTAEISGEVTGDIFAFGGSTTLSSSAVINGSIDQVFHEIDVEPGASVTGEINTYSNPFAFRQAWSGINAFFPYVTNPERVLTSRLIVSAVFCLLACLLVYLLPKPTQNCVRTIQNQPGAAWGVGFLVLLVAPLVLLILTITICLSPIALVLLVAFMLSILFGWIVLAVITGEKFNQWLYLKMPPVVQTFIGALIISVAVSLVSLIPCLGIAVSMLFGCYGLGGVIISRFGKIEDKGNNKAKRPSGELSASSEPQVPKELKK
ncbi:MAG: polymer-forming cytoskeletal protein [Anaerolineaceae bacterium]